MFLHVLVGTYARSTRLTTLGTAVHSERIAAQPRRNISFVTSGLSARAVVVLQDSGATLFLEVFTG